MVAIGMTCIGQDQPKCTSCTTHTPRFADITIGASDGQSESVQTPGDRYALIRQFLDKPVADRLAFWESELSRCIKCYACRQACPLCYCQRCLVDKNRPTCIDTSATLKGNFAWHILRAFHLAGRCTGCGECTRACPAGIDLHLLNLSLAQAADDHFDYRPGEDPKAEPAVGAYRQDDQEDFIR